jgi:hypothetical protein
MFIILTNLEAIEFMDLFSYYFMSMFLTLATRMPELILSLFIIWKFIIEIWLELSSHADDVIDPRKLFSEYLYPGYIVLLSSILAMLICSIFNYPSLCNFRIHNAQTSSPLQVKVMMVLMPIAYIALWETSVLRFTDEIPRAIMGLLGIVMIILHFSFCVAKLYQRIFSYCRKRSIIENIVMTPEEKNMEYAMIIGGICSFLVCVSAILTWRELSPLSFLRNFTFAFIVCLFLVLLTWCCTNRLKDPVIPKDDGFQVAEPVTAPSSPLPMYYSSEVIDKVALHYPRIRPSISLLRSNSIRRR